MMAKLGFSLISIQSCCKDDSCSGKVKQTSV